MLKRLLGASLLLVSSLALLAADAERSVVQIFTFSQQPMWEAPWRNDPVRRSGGTGFVVRGRKIMTNAHVVSWARQILVRRYQDPRPYPARVLFIGHDCDLAVLEVEEPAFFDGIEPLELGGLPTVRSTVVTCGYPAGGEQISYTRGVVSRIEVQSYVHIGNRAFLSVQTDAAINPGNSGGPVLQEDKVVGVAFMGMPGLENAGFFIPPSIITHFLTDIEDGRYDGFPTAGIRLVPLQNPAYRRYLKLPDNDQGARVDSVLPIPETEKLIRQDDVLLKVNGFEVGSDGTVVFEGNRVSATIAFHQAQSGGSVPLTIWREGRAQEISLPVSVYSGDRTLGNQYDTLPRYYVHAGLVFVPLSLDYLKTFGRDWREAANAETVYELYYRRYEAPRTLRSEPVVLASTLPDPVNADMKLTSRSLVDKINGIRIDRIEDAVRAIETNTNTFHVIEFLSNHAIEALDRQAADAANAAILKNYGITKDRRL